MVCGEALGRDGMVFVDSFDMRWEWGIGCCFRWVASVEINLLKKLFWSCMRMLLIGKLWWSLYW